MVRHVLLLTNRVTDILLSECDGMKMAHVKTFSFRLLTDEETTAKELKRLWLGVVVKFKVTHYPGIFPEGMSKPRKASVRIRCLRVENIKLYVCML